MQTNRPTISVIVPVYNAEKWLRRCIDSILAQTYTDFELLLIDDGSTDSSGAICDEYATKDSRVLSFHKPNGGVSTARALGVFHAFADWITFVDSDDELEFHCLSQFYLSIADDIDIVFGFHETESITKELIDIETYRAWCLSGYRIAPWAKLFRRSLFTKATFDIPREIKIGEDWLMNIRLAFTANKNVKILRTNNIIYHYHNDNDNQITKKFINTLQSTEKFIQYYKLSIPNSERDKYIKAICKANLYLLTSLLNNSYKIPLQKSGCYKFLIPNWNQSGLSLRQKFKFLLFSSIVTRFLMNIYIKYPISTIKIFKI